MQPPLLNRIFLHRRCRVQIIVEFNSKRDFTNLPPLSFPVVVLEQALIVRNSVLAVNPPLESIHISVILMLIATKRGSVVAGRKALAEGRLV